MKEIIIITSLIILITILSIFSQNFLNKTSSEFLEKLESLKNDLNQSSDSITIFKDKAETIYSEWKDLNEKWSIIVLHSELDLIEVSLVEMKASIETNNFGDAIKATEKTISLINHIVEKEKIDWKNIF